MVDLEYLDRVIREVRKETQTRGMPISDQHKFGYVLDVLPRLEMVRQQQDQRNS